LPHLLGNLLAQQMLIDISTLARQVHPFPSYRSHTRTTSSSELNRHFPMLVRQRLMELPIEPLQAAYPTLSRWLNEVEAAAPELFAKRRKRWLDVSIRSRLNIDEQTQYWIEVQVDLAFRKGIPILYEWGIRSSKFFWQDKVKLWAVTEAFDLHPDQAQMILIAIRPDGTAERRKYQWNQDRHQKAATAIAQLLSSEMQEPFRDQQSKSEPFDLAQIPEITL
jgi:hypothetical protein